MKRAAWVALPIVFAVAAGCLAAPTTDYESVETAVESAAAPLLVPHNDAKGHFQAALHAGSMNLELVGYHNGADDSGDPSHIPPAAYFTEIAVQGGYAYLNRLSGDGSAGGFVIVDARNPYSPRFAGEWKGQGGVDVEVDPEGQVVYYATQRNTPAQLAGGLTRDPTTAEPRGIVAVSVADKAAPVHAGYTPLPYNGPHTLTYVRHPDGNDYLVVCTYDLVSTTVPGQPGVVSVTQRVLIFQVDRRDGPDGVSVLLTPVSTYQIARQAPTPYAYMPHDARAEVHPVTGDVLLYVAYWDLGLRILDITDPASPKEVSTWTDFAPSAHNNIHLAAPLPFLVGGRHVTVAEPEIVDSPAETGQITFLDTTDPARPAKLGHWTLPEGRLGQLGITGLDFSPHNFEAWDGRVALAHNHAGVWVIDVHDEEGLQDPRSVGFYMPAKVRPDSPVMQPRVWSVVARPDAATGETLLYASDEATGLYILRYTGP